MLLAIDVGNTNTVIGIYDDGKSVGFWRIRTVKEMTADEYRMILHDLTAMQGMNVLEAIDGAIIACVVPPLSRPLEDLCVHFLKVNPLFVGPGIKTGMPIRYDNPREVGADRIVNAVAAYERYRSELIAVDFGTATTFDYVNRKGEYCGGAIAPGLAISMEALFQKASKLPRVEVVKPPCVIARNTVNSMQAGIVYGYVGLVDGIVTRMKAEGKENATVIATGGLAALIAPESKTIETVEEHLTLEGLRILYERNRE